MDQITKKYSHIDWQESSTCKFGESREAGICSRWEYFSPWNHGYTIIQVDGKHVMVEMLLSAAPFGDVQCSSVWRCDPFMLWNPQDRTYEVSVLGGCRNPHLPCPAAKRNTSNAFTGDDLQEQEVVDDPSNNTHRSRLHRQLHVGSGSSVCASRAGNRP